MLYRITTNLIPLAAYPAHTPYARRTNFNSPSPHIKLLPVEPGQRVELENSNLGAMQKINPPGTLDLLRLIWRKAERVIGGRIRRTMYTARDINKRRALHLRSHVLVKYS
jgi:hypothetical protein